MSEGISGYAPADLFKTGPVTTQTPAVAPVSESVAEAAPTETVVVPATSPTESVSESVQETLVPQHTEKVEVAPIVTPTVQPIVASSQPPKNPLEELKVDDVAKFYKDKREDLMKALGYDDFAIEAIRYYESTGGLADYAAVKSVDFSKMSDEDLLRKGLREEFAHLSPTDEDIDLLYENRITNRFKTDESVYSEREVRAGKLEMKFEADKLRQSFIEKQKKFIAPPRMEPAPVETVAEVTPEQRASMMRDVAMKDAAVKQFIASKKIILGGGEHTYNYEIGNPETLMGIMTDPQQYSQAVAQKNEQGNPVVDTSGNIQPNYNKLLKAAALLQDDEAYDRMLINYGKSLGTKELIDQVENPTNTQVHGPETAPTTIWSAMKSNGKWS